MQATNRRGFLKGAAFLGAASEAPGISNEGTDPRSNFSFGTILPHSAKISAANCSAGPRLCALTA